MKANINGRDPFYRAAAVEAMFDQSVLPAEKRTLPLRPFQRTMLAASTLYNFVDIYAPSQSGKTTGVSALAAELMYEFPGISILVLSSREEQAARIIHDIRTNFVKCHRHPELRALDPKGGDSSVQLRLQHSQSSVIALPHSMRAIAGNPARVVLLDEMARWESEDPRVIYAEAVARTGDKPNFLIMTISTFFGESQLDPGSVNGFRGSFFHYKWNKSWQNRNDPNKQSVAFKFSYHVSPNLQKNIEIYRKELPEDIFNEHYLGIPRKVVGQPIFAGSYKPNIHVTKDSQVKLTDNEPLFLCFDPGDRKCAATLGQLDPSAPRLVYLRSYLSDGTIFPTFIDQVLLKVKKQFSSWDLLFFIDAAAKNPDGKTGDTFEQILSRKVGYTPISMRQDIEPGIEVIKSFMHRVDGFQISDHPECAWLREALESGLVAQEIGGRVLRKYKKDGVFDHIGDTARYPVFYLANGMTADAFEQQGPSFFMASSPYD